MPTFYLSGILLKILASFFFTIMSVFLKLGGKGYPITELIFSRSFFAFIPIMIWLIWRKKLPSALKTKWFSGHFARVFIALFAMACNFSAILLLPLADVTAISYASPLLTVVLAAVFLKEDVRIYRWVAVFVGLFGVMVMISPYLKTGFDFKSNEEALGAVLAFVGALLVAIAITQVRRLTATESTATTVFYFSLIASALSVLTFPFGWVMPTFYDGLFLVLAGITGGLAQICLTESFRIAPASLLAPFQYTSMIWSVLFGVYLFSEPLQPIVMVGAVIVIGSGLFVIYREYKRGFLTNPAKRPILPTDTLGGSS